MINVIIFLYCTLIQVLVAGWSFSLPPSGPALPAACRRDEAEVRIFDFKTTWSEFKRSSQTAAERGNAELRTLNFKTTWSEFQKTSQTAPERGKAEL